MIDSHCHINDEAFSKNPAEYVKEAEKAGVFQFLVVGCNKESSEQAVEISNQNKGCQLCYRQFFLGNYNTLKNYKESVIDKGEIK